MCEMEKTKVYKEKQYLIFDFEIGLGLALKRLFPKVLAYLAECDAKKM